MTMYSADPPPLQGLSESTLDPDPLRLFRAWLEAAEASGVILPEAMALATVGPDSRPAARMVLLRGLDERGFIFFTNYDSRKGHELAANAQAALLFHWATLERQVRIEGQVELVTTDESDAYFQSRPRGSRLAAWASPQSQIIAGRDYLEQRMAEFQARFGEGFIPRPPEWGGYRVLPASIEFWQGQPNRLHNRFRYVRTADGLWRSERLAP